MLAATFRPPATGWYTRPPSAMQRRGRSKQVSRVALARQASEERRRSTLHEKLSEAACNFISSIDIVSSQQSPPPCPLPSAEKCHPSSTPAAASPVIPEPASPLCHLEPVVSSAPKPTFLRSHSPLPSDHSSGSSTPPSLSPEYYESPPSPPLSLEDQVHVAYAEDDIRLAKILLLKLKGIEVMSENDSRIDEVRDEDFDFCFVPSGPLKLNDVDKKAIEEAERREKERKEARQRMERLKACQKFWEEQKRRMRTERMLVMRKREEQLALEEERRQFAEMKEREAAEQIRFQRLPQLRVEREEDPFQYEVMPPIQLHASSSVGISGRLLRSKEAVLRSPNDGLRTVPFKDVINSMQGPLFPLDPTEQTKDPSRCSGSTIHVSIQHRRGSLQLELLISLLEVTEGKEDVSHKAKGKAAERPVLYEKSASGSRVLTCAACSAASLSTLPSSTATTRTTSWLSFATTRASTSFSTTATTPATSPLSSWFKSPSALHSPALTVPESRPLCFSHSCRPHCSLASVNLEESPLFVPEVRCAVSKPTGANQDPPVRGRSEIVRDGFWSRRSLSRTLVHRVSKSVSHIVDVAKSVQTAYISAAMFAVPTPYPRPSRSTSPSRNTDCPAMPLKPQGYRVSPSDLAKFTACIDDDVLFSAEPVTFVPLVSPFPPPPVNPLYSSTSSSRSLVPSIPIPPSPLRPRIPPTELVFRMRPVANPAMLRLKALQNLMYMRGKEWEGRARENGLGCGKERVLGIAFDGRGRSGLGCEVRFVVS